MQICVAVILKQTTAESDEADEGKVLRVTPVNVEDSDGVNNTYDEGEN